MRILALITDAFGGSGGIALYNRDFLTALCEHPKCKEVVALPRLMPNESELQPEKLTWLTSGLGGKGAYIKALLKMLVSDRRFDLIICAHLNLLPIAWLVKNILRVPLLVELYGVEAWAPTGRWFTKRMIYQVDVYTSISTITRDRFLAWSGVDEKKIHLLPNAIHTEWYEPGPKDSELLARYGLKGKKVIMTLGRMSASEQYKGFDEVLDVLPDLAKQIPEIAYLVVGDGDDRVRLEEKAKVLGVDERVIFAGFVSENQKADYYRLADLYVMPSYGEGFGFVFLEALACGIPVVASTLDGGRDAVRDGQLGGLVDPKNPTEINSAIQKFLESSRNIPAGLEYFSFEKFKCRCSVVIDNLINNYCSII